MSLQTVFKFGTCWCAPNIVRQVVPRGRACDGEHTLAEPRRWWQAQRRSVSHLMESRSLTCLGLPISRHVRASRFNHTVTAARVVATDAKAWLCTASHQLW